jgi:serine/threonine protein phosphatase 1
LPRVAAIGDVHGEIHKLRQLLGVLEKELAPEDTLLFIGDYIDRGPDSKGVVDLVLSLREHRNVVALRGNHEQMLLDAYRYSQPEQGALKPDWEFASNWFSNGSKATLESYGEAARWWQRIPEEHWAFFRSTLIEYKVGNYHFVHAGMLPKGVRWDMPEYPPKLWIREEFLESTQDFGAIVVFGHTPMKRPLVMGNKIGIDTGATYGGPLTAIVVDPEERFCQDRLQIFQAQ